MTATVMPDDYDGTETWHRWMTAVTLDTIDGAGRQQSWTAATMLDGDNIKQ